MTTVRDFLAGVRDTQSDAFRQILDKHGKHISRYLTTILPDKHDCEDVLSECFQKLWESKTTFETEEKMLGYLIISAKHISYNLIRSRKRSEKRNQVFASGLEMIQEPTVELPIAEELLNKIYVSIEHLPEKQKQVMKMILFEGMTEKQIAKKLDNSLSTIYNLKAIAVKYLLNNVVRPQLTISILCMVAILIAYII